MADPLAKRKKRRIASALGLGGLLPLVALAAFWPAGFATVILVFATGALLALAADAQLRVLTPREEMIGREGVVAFVFRPDGNGVYRGNVQIGTESWTATATEAEAPMLTAGRKIRVTGIDGLVLRVEPIERKA